MKFNIGDVVTRIKDNYRLMGKNDIDEVIDINQYHNLCLKKYGEGHDPNMFRLATEEEKQEYYKKQGIIINEEANYQIF